MNRLRYQGMIYFIKTLSDPPYKNLQNVEPQIKQPANHYANLNRVYQCFPIKVKT